MTVHANRSWKILTIALGTLAVALVTVFGSGLGPVEAGLPGPLQVTVTVSASDPGGNPLTYRWRSSDGQIANVNAPTTTWTLADGPGLHFAYVLASNGHGGYTEQRVVVNTDTIGTPIQTYPPVTLQAPPAAIPVGETYRRFTFRPDLLFYAQDDSNTLRVPATGYVKSDLKEQIILRGITPVLSPPVTMNLFCSIAPGGPFDVCGQIVPDIGTPTPPTNLPRSRTPISGRILSLRRAHPSSRVRFFSPTEPSAARKASFSASRRQRSWNSATRPTRW